jgi:hypothetical protein
MSKRAYKNVGTQDVVVHDAETGVLHTIPAGETSVPITLADDRKKWLVDEYRILRPTSAPQEEVTPEAAEAVSALMSDVKDESPATRSRK